MENHTPPADTRAILRKAAHRDRRFFETYPAQFDYSRPFMRGEAWPLNVRCTRVVVASFKPGHRMVMALDGAQGDEVWPSFDYDLLAGTEGEEAAYALLHRIVALAEGFVNEDEGVNGERP